MDGTSGKEVVTLHRLSKQTHKLLYMGLLLFFWEVGEEGGGV